MRSALTSLLADVVVAAAAAQSPETSKPTAPPDGSTVTVSGCLAKGDAANTFVLNNVRWDSSNTPTAQGAHHNHQAPATASPAQPPLTTPSTPPTAPAPSAAKKTADDAMQKAARPSGESLRLAGAATQLKLSDHVGHTITATGMIAQADPVVTPAVILPGSPDKPARIPDDKKSAAPARVLNMRSFTHVAAECK